MINPFYIHLQIAQPQLHDALQLWVAGCTDLKLTSQATLAHIQLLDWPAFDHMRQSGNALPHAYIVFIDALNTQQETQVLTSGALDCLHIGSLQDHIQLRLSMHIQRLQHVLKLESLSVTDTLTGLFNRRKFDQELDICWRQGIREQTPSALLYIDVDHFKAFNDTYGHLAGDQCLRELAKVFSNEAVRPYDVASRIGGEEFAIILPNTHKAGALHVAHRIIQQVAQLNILNEHTRLGRLSLSIGLACCLPSQQGSIKHWQEQADDALYAAKENGRNQVVSEVSVPAGHETEFFN